MGFRDIVRCLKPRESRRTPLIKTQLSTAAEKLRNVLQTQTLCALGRATGLTKRMREVTPDRFALSLICALAMGKVNSLADVVRSFNALTGRSVQYKPFHNQLSKAAFPVFMERVCEKMLGELVGKVLRPVSRSVLDAFDDIWIQDGTSFALHHGLAEAFPGRFTTLTPAAVEIHATMSLYQDEAIAISIAPDSWGEREFLPAPTALRGILILADRGYTDKAYARHVTAAGGSFVIRFKKGMNPTVVSGWVANTRMRGLVGKPLHALMGKFRKKTVDLDVVWGTGEHKIEMRLLLAWNPQEQAHMILATNLNRETFDTATVLTLYRLRWQVELLFKEWKSHSNMHKFSTTKPQIAEGMMWASLCAAILKRYLAHTVDWIYKAADTSTRKVAMALGHHLPPLIKALLHNRNILKRFQELLEYLKSNASRAHPVRDRKRGRLALDLQLVGSLARAF